MMVVADSSPLIVLVQIGHVDVLPRLFGQILIPPTVARELRSPRRSLEVQEYFQQALTWLAIRPPARVEAIQGLQPGEQEAISLAIEVGADLLLVDERKAYREAVARKLNAIGAIRVLERAADAKWIDLKDSFERIKQTDFWISHHLLDERLKLHLRSTAP